MSDNYAKLRSDAQEFIKASFDSGEEIPYGITCDLFNALEAVLAELDATRERVAKLEAALIHAERNLGLICRCAPGYQCALCHVREALKETGKP